MIKIKTNKLTQRNVLIPDMGFYIPKLGKEVELDTEDLDLLNKSKDLKRLISDSAYSGEPTLFLILDNNILSKSEITEYIRGGSVLKEEGDKISLAIESDEKNYHKKALIAYSAIISIVAIIELFLIIL